MVNLFQGKTKFVLIISLFILSIHSFGQTKRPEDFGFRHFQIFYKGDTVDILIKSKKGEENISKPLFFYCQGSLPQPLIKTDNEITYGFFYLNPTALQNIFTLQL